jgi:hypothetical protein
MISVLCCSGKARVKAPKRPDVTRVGGVRRETDRTRFQGSKISLKDIITVEIMGSQNPGNIHDKEWALLHTKNFG